jgi:hypothetical protein
MLYHGTRNGSASRRQLEAVLPRDPWGVDLSKSLTGTAKRLLDSQDRLAANNVTLQADFQFILHTIYFLFN